MIMKLKEKLTEGHAVNEKGYFDSYRNNIYGGEMSPVFQQMFDDGSGGELHSKAEAVHSSSMLSYNFFHWINEDHPFVWDGVKYTTVLFEVKMKTVKIKGKDNNPSPANMDVVLINEDKSRILFIESKFLEYLESKKFYMPKSYFDEGNYYNKELKEELMRIAKYVPSSVSKYKEGIKQLITHLFGINTLLVESCEVLKDIDFQTVRMKFITLIFEPNKSDFKEEWQAYDNYNKLVVEFKKGLDNGLIVKPEWISYSDLWKEMKEQIIPKELRAFLWERYMRFAGRTEK